MRRRNSNKPVSMKKEEKKCVATCVKFRLRGFPFVPRFIFSSLFSNQMLVLVKFVLAVARVLFLYASWNQL